MSRRHEARRNAATREPARRNPVTDIRHFLPSTFYRLGNFRLHEESRVSDQISFTIQYPEQIIFAGITVKNPRSR